MDAPGGCGKTYLWETLYYNIISNYLIKKYLKQVIKSN